MLINVVKVAIFLAAPGFAQAATTTHHQGVEVAKREPCGYGGCQEGQGGGFAQGHGYGQVGGGIHGGAGIGASAGVGVSAGLNGMVQGWGQLTPAFNQLQTSFSSGASIQVAIQAASSLRTQVQSVTSQYSSCGCSATPQASAAFQTMAVQFFSSFQLALQTGQAHFGAQWDSQFRPIFQQYSSAFTTMHSIAASLRVDLGGVLTRAHVNPQIFAGVGLNLNGLLGVNLGVGVGGLLHL